MSDLEPSPPEQFFSQETDLVFPDCDSENSEKKPDIKQETISSSHRVQAVIQRSRKLETTPNLYSYFPSPSETLRIVSFLFISIVAWHVYAGVRPILELPTTLQHHITTIMDQGIYGIPAVTSIKSFFLPSSTNFTSQLGTSLEYITDLDMKKLASLSVSLNSASDILYDLPIATYDFPSQEVEKESEQFRSDVQDLALSLRKGYRDTFRVFLRSRTFMERGGNLVDKIAKQAREEKGDSAARSLVTLMNEVNDLREKHEEADAQLEEVYRQVTILKGEAKKKSTKHAKEVEKLQRGWTLQQKVTMYSLSLVLGAFTGGALGIPASLSAVGLYEFVDQDVSNIQAEKFERVAQTFLRAYTALNDTRNILHRDIQVLSGISEQLEELIKNVHDVGIFLSDNDLEELNEVAQSTKIRMAAMHEEYTYLLDEQKRGRKALGESEGDVFKS